MIPLQRSIRDFDRPADRIRQHRQADRRPVVVLEGATDDRMMREAFGSIVVTFPVGTRSVALETVQQLHLWQMRQIVGVVDRDFDDVVGKYVATNLPMHPYENADLEAMLSFTDAFRLLVQEVGSAEKLEAFGGADVLRQKLVEIALPVARLRAANSLNQWGLAFDEVDLADKVNQKTLEFNLNGFCTALRAKSQNAPRQDVLLSWASGATSHPSPPRCPRSSRPYVRGKDLMSALGVSMRGKVGNCEKAATRSDHMSAILRAVSCSMLADMGWTKDLLALLVKQV